MSKQVKQMQMEVLANTFRDVKDMVFMTAQGVDAITENKIRLNLRKKNILLMMVKNSLLRRVFTDFGIKPADEAWAGTTVVAWGGDSIKELSKELDTAFFKDVKLKEKVKPKTALAEGQPVTFAQALAMPTRKEAIGEIISALLAPAAGIASALTNGASQVASQIQTISEKKPEGEAAPAA